MGDPVTPLDRRITEGLFGLSLRGTANLGGDESAQFLTQALRNVYNEQSNPDGCISLGVAENTLSHDLIRDFANAKPLFREAMFAYGDSPSGSHHLRRSLAALFNERFSPITPVDRTQIIVTTGCSGVVDQLCWVLADDGEGILIQRPLYGGFIRDLTMRSRVKPVLVGSRDVDTFGPEIVTRYEETLLRSEAVGVKIQALLFCNPNNPLGKCYSPKAIKDLLALCQKYQIHFISDEIYALSKYETNHSATAQEFVSVLSIPLDGLIDPHLVHVVYGMSKDFSCNGMRLGVFVTQHNPGAFKAMESLSLFAWPSSPAMELWARMLDDRAWLDSYLEENSKRLSMYCKRAVKWLERNNINYIKGGNYGFFIWIDLRFALPPEDQGMSGLSRERDLTKRMLDGGVYLATGENFCGEYYGWYRLTFTTTLLEKGLTRLEKVLYGPSSHPQTKSQCPTLAEAVEEAVANLRVPN